MSTNSPINITINTLRHLKRAVWRGLNLRRVIFIIFTVIFCVSAAANDSENRKLFIVHFKVGPNWVQSLAAQEQQSFKAHSLNMNRLRKEQTIVFGARYSDLGVIIIKAKSLDSARSLIKKDPGVKAGIFNFDIEKLNVFYPWKE